MSRIPQSFYTRYRDSYPHPYFGGMAQCGSERPTDVDPNVMMNTPPCARAGDRARSAPIAPERRPAASARQMEKISTRFMCEVARFKHLDRDRSTPAKDKHNVLC
ncbi:hypothetical protein EVAR_61246_1 [Eumeta japonica]|uniref:Uncharacterized protein n=1 Tax=Eumeta variegata TaxID=151549 RepID=A0A4C1Z576_EUMVA|nr:hypothetical protein EVAR_61246_1 [Eumeta japonica]